MIPALLKESVSVYRRISTGADVLGNPTYGDPITGIGWITVYTVMPARLAFTDKKIQFVAVGERVQPEGTLYYASTYTLLPEDRVVTQDNVQYVVTSTRVAYKTAGGSVDHYEAILNLV